VVAVVVGDNGEIDSGEVAAQLGRVLDEEVLLPRVQEDLPAAGFDVEG
jgi:hypothetical protein